MAKKRKKRLISKPRKGGYYFVSAEFKTKYPRAWNLLKRTT